MKIDIDKLNIEIDKFKKVNERLVKFYEDLTSKNTKLKNTWETELSEVVFASFEDFYKYVEYLINKNNLYINYLEEKVRDNYLKFEKNIDNSINDNIS